ncbi:MAG: class I SAM-dependent methyltransferase [Candidatus Melainabacteria bacterium]|nr:class I SAM-dependent methyltransferase [Candidatus Melainabacteria bacterium]
MNTSIPIKIVDGVQLIANTKGICKVVVSNHDAKTDLSWDRFVRLNAAAKAVIASGAKTILDAGGFDGALGLFLTDLETNPGAERELGVDRELGVEIDLIDPATTGGSVLEIPAADGSYDAVAAIDVLEHIDPKNRVKALAEFARVAREYVILNYPCQDSKDAQALVLKLTNNPLIKEHVQWALPDSDWVLGEMDRYGFKGTVKAHTSIAIWLGQYLTLNLVPDKALELNRHLIENFADEPCGKALYHLVVCRRNDGPDLAR